MQDTKVSQKPRSEGGGGARHSHVDRQSSRLPVNTPVLGLEGPTTAQHVGEGAPCPMYSRIKVGRVRQSDFVRSNNEASHMDYTEHCLFWALWLSFPGSNEL